MGKQASGKSSFCRERFFTTHVRINMLETCLATQTAFDYSRLLERLVATASEP